MKLSELAEPLAFVATGAPCSAGATMLWLDPSPVWTVVMVVIDVSMMGRWIVLGGDCVVRRNLRHRVLHLSW